MPDRLGVVDTLRRTVLMLPGADVDDEVKYAAVRASATVSMFVAMSASASKQTTRARTPDSKRVRQPTAFT
jgi:hypothetical protein